MLKKGLIHVYTGDGKGKTTAAMGLALRMAGHGGRVLIYQFLKPAELELGERKALAFVPGITLKVLDCAWDMRNSFDDEQAVAQTKAAIHAELAALARQAGCKAWDMLILDEIIFCLDKNLADFADIKRLIDSRDKAVEIVLTGRGAGKEIIALADLVSEIKSVSHPFDKGIKARRGIEF